MLSRCYFKKSKSQIPLVAFYKRATVSESLFKKEQKRAIRSKKFIFFTIFWQFFTAFPLFYAQEQISPIALCSVIHF